MKLHFEIALIFLILSASAATADEIEGIALLEPSNCPAAGLTVEVDPVRGSPQSKVLTITQDDGSFVARVIAGRYLLVLYQQGTKVYQSEIELKGTANVRITLTAAGSSGSAPCSRSANPPASGEGHITPPAGLLHFRVSSATTGEDLAIDTDGAFLVLDGKGEVMRLSRTTATFDSTRLFALPVSSTPIAVAANDQEVLVTAKGVSECILYVYNKTSRQRSARPFLSSECSGIAVDGQKTYVAFYPDREVRVFGDLLPSKWGHIALPFFPPQALSKDSYSLAVDGKTSELFAGDDAGLLSVFSANKWRPLDQNLGAIASIGVSTHYLIVASANGVTCFDRRSEYARVHGRCLGAGLRGELTGVRVDAAQNAWVLRKYESDLVGPFPVQ